MLEILSPFCYNTIMNANFSFISKANCTVAIAVSGGVDSMALLHYAKKNEKKLNITVVAINVEHGIRGESSISDTLFVKDYCAKNNVPLYQYAVDCPKYATENKLSLEEAARILRYQCFDDAFNKNKFDFLATAHHQKDNAETVLFNLFRGTSSKGLRGIPYQNGYVVRPLLDVSKQDVLLYAKRYNVPFVVDESNFSLDYTRNFIRSLLPKINEKFPLAEQNVSRLCSIVREEDDYLENQAKTLITYENGAIKLPINAPKVLLKRAIILSIKALGVKKDWQNVHINDTLSLTQKENGSSINLLGGIIACREYDCITLSLSKNGQEIMPIPFCLGRFTLGEKTVVIENALKSANLKDGLYGDLDKIPSDAVIRFKKDGDVFTKFGGGTKSLGDYLTDLKVPKRLRQTLPLLATKEKVLVIFGLSVSNDLRVEKHTKNIIKFTEEK